MQAPGIVTCVIVLLILQACPVFAENPAPISGKPENGLVSSAPISQPKVSHVRRVLSDSEKGKTDAAGLGDTICVKVENLAQFLDDPDKKDKPIHLFLNRMELKGIRPEHIDRAADELQFRLLRRDALPDYTNDTQQKSVWASLFGFRDQWRLARAVEASVGWEGGSALPSDAKLTLIRIRTGGALIYLGMLAGLILLYRWAIGKGAFLDRGTLDDEQSDRERAWSLARVQMGWWFFLVVAAFFFIWIVIGELPSIPASVLGLIGIAAGTALGAAAIDVSKRSGAGLDLQQKTAQKAVLDGKVAALSEKIDNSTRQKARLLSDIAALRAATPAPAPDIDQQDEFAAKLGKEISDLQNEKRDLEVQQQLLDTQIRNAQPDRHAVASRGWLADLLSDADGLSFHRLQMAVWTVVLGIVFVEQVLSNLSLPDFDNTLLALMGISSGTYLGFKFPEQQPK